MRRQVEVGRSPRSLSGEEAERLFATVDETGHTDEERATRQHARRREQGASVAVDPLAGDDPSGATTDRQISRTAFGFIVTLLVCVVVLQVGWGYVRRVTTATLAEDASMLSVMRAVKMGVEWGGGFTQFPSEFSVQEADEGTHRIEVTVVDSSSTSDLDVFATAQVQASALSVNALLNPNIDTVVYHVKVRRDEKGRLAHTHFFGYLRPTGTSTPLMTFVWTKTATEDGVRFDCAITGVDTALQASLHDAITSKSTPATIINYVIQDDDELVLRLQELATDGRVVREGVEALLAVRAERDAQVAARMVEQAVRVAQEAIAERAASGV